MFKHHTHPDLQQEDVDRAIETVRQIASATTNLWETDPDAAFLAYAKEVVGLAEAGTLTPMEASYVIAGYYLQIDTENEKVIGIGDLACELESPEELMSQPAETAWNILVSLTK